jgi:signal transduction histidine kinase
MRSATNGRRRTASRLGPCQRVRWPAAVGTAAGTVALPAWAAADPGPGLGPWLLGCVALVVVAAAGYAVGASRAERQLAAVSRLARSEARTALQLIDGWHWQTDGTHVLRRLDPPAVHADGTPPAAAGVPLWQCFEAVAGVGVAGLQARLESQSAFVDLRARAADGSLWLLRGTPRIDEAGHFAGHSGVARLLAEDDARRLEQAAFATLISAQAGPALLLARPAGDGRWRIVVANDAGADLLDARAGEGRGDALAAVLPPPVRDGLDKAGPGDDAPMEIEGWRLAALPRPAGAGQAAIAWRPAAGGSGSGTEPGDTESFTYTVSHDLRAPIRVVEGFTRIVKEDYGRLLDRVGNDHLDRVLGAAARMNLMIDAMLGLARLSSQPLAHQPVNLSQLAGYVVDDLRRHAPERDAEVTIEAGLQTTGDPTLLRLVLENLLGNAWKYSARTARARITFGSEVHDGRRVYAVRDNGAGFDMRSAERLFGLFQRLHSQSDFPGTGVGLASTRRIVRRHGGEIWAEGQVGRGATFYFTLGR